MQLFGMNRWVLVFLIVVLGAASIAFFSTPPIIEKLGGYVSVIETNTAFSIVYVDVSPAFDNDNDGNPLNDKDVWVSTRSEIISNQMKGFVKGSYFLATVEWMPEESDQFHINRYYIQSIHEIRK